jgi:heterodisulfide reductase subunit A
VQGEAGDFQVTLNKRPRYVDPDKCIACGTCAEKCPAKAVDEFNQGLSKRKAIYVPYAQAVPLKYAIDEDRCIYFKKGKCRACEKYCPTEAIDFGDTAREVTLNAGAVILSAGFQTFDPSSLDLYQYSECQNVITGMEFERILSANGPFQGHLVRPSDHEEPKKIAWLQCVGSRDINRCQRPYCSAVCCMYAVKEAVVAKEHTPGLDTAIFYMDMRTYGKDFERYYDRAREEEGVRFVRSRIHSVLEDPETKNLHLSYIEEDGELRTEEFDMVVLSVGMETTPEFQRLSEDLGVELDAEHLVRTEDFTPVQTSRSGVFVCGALQEPKDIPTSVMEASAAACGAEVELARARGSEAQSKVFPEERDVSGETPRIGVFVCNCGVNIGGIVDVPQVADHVRNLPNVAYVQENLFSCSQDTQDQMKQIISEQGLNRVVVAACTPRTHEALFQETLLDAGLNKYLFEMANIRNQCSWVHSKEKDRATEKAKDLVQMAVTRARNLHPLPQPTVPVDSRALVVGGGAAGMTAALGLAEQGFYTYLLEKQDRLGGNARSLASTRKGETIPDKLEAMSERVQGHGNIEVLTQAEIREASGFVGNFQTRVNHAGTERDLEHGAVIIAVGASEHTPGEYRYGESDRVLTHLELDRAFAEGDPRVTRAGSVTFVQCVGSREPERPYCSKVCCTHSIKAALRFKEQNPETQVYVLYRDIRTYGQREDLYHEARRKGIVFIRFDLDTKPVVEQGEERLDVRVTDHILQRELILESDLVVLASAITRPAEEPLAQMYKLPVNEDNFFMEAHAKLRPVEFATDGIFLAGLAHYPKPLEESIAQAQAAASRAATVLSREQYTVEGLVSRVDEALCRGCGECEQACPYNAIAVEEVEPGQYRARVRAAMCKGCGACAVACPTGAAAVYNFEESTILDMVQAALR